MAREPSTLAAFAAANDAVAATTKKLAKQAALAAYLGALEDADLVRAVRFAGGRPFATHDERTLGVSGAAVSAVVLDMFELDGADWSALLVKHGEFGEAMAHLWQERVEQGPKTLGAPALTLADLQDTWDSLATTGQQEAKRRLLRGLLGRIRTGREAAYVGKIIFSDLRTGVREGVLHAAIAEAFGRDPAAVRRAILLVGDAGDVALLAKHDRLGEARFTLFHPISFMLAGAVETAHEAAEAIAEAPQPWFAEHKLDGIRAQLHKQSSGPEGARVAIYTRTMDRTDESFPEIVAHARTLPGDWLLDGEIVPYDDEAGVVLPFGMLQKRLGRKVPDEQILERYPCRFIAFDLLYRDGRTLLDEPLAARRAELEALVGSGEGILLSRMIPVRSEAEIASTFDEARRARNEGLVLKGPASPYTPGRRGGAWIKLKTHLPTLDVVVTAAEHGHGRRRNVLSDYTFAVWDRDPAEEGAQLLNVGKAYSGVTDAEIEQLTELFLSIQTGVHHGRYYTVRPQVVFEVAFDAIQRSPRHASGFALRFPRIKRIRLDRSPESADRLERVREIFEHEQNFNRSTSGEASPLRAVTGRRARKRKEQPGLFD